MIDCQFTFLYAAALLALCTYLQSPGGRRAVLLGCIRGLAALTRAAGARAVGADACILLLATRARGSARRCMWVCCARRLRLPFCRGRSAIGLWGQFIPLGTGGGYMLYLENSGFAEQRFLLHMRPSENAYIHLLGSQPDSWSYVEAWRFIVTDPARFLQLTAQKCAALWKILPRWRSFLWTVPAAVAYLVPPIAGAV
jgi:hypothetical protein